MLDPPFSTSNNTSTNGEANYSISQAPWWQHISASTRKEVVVGEHPECEQQGFFRTQKTKKVGTKYLPSTYLTKPTKSQPPAELELFATSVNASFKAGLAPEK